MRPKANPKTVSVPKNIIVLSLLGMIGICLIAGVNLYLNTLKNQSVKVLQGCFDIMQYVHNIQLTEIRFIRYAEDNDLKHYKTLYSQFENSLNDFIGFKKDLFLEQKAEELKSQYFHHADVFSRVEVQTLRAKTITTDLNHNTQILISRLDHIVADLNNKETDLMLTGSFLDPLLYGLRSEIKDYVNLWSKNLINIQELLLFSDIERFTDANKVVTDGITGTLYNLSLIIEATQVEGYADYFKENIAPLIPLVNDLKQEFIDVWLENKRLGEELDFSGKQLKSTAAAIAHEAGFNIEKSRNIGGQISIGLAVAGILLLIALSAGIYRLIMNSINSIIPQLNDTSRRVFDSAGRLAEGSRMLAELSFQSAKSVDEASASLDQISDLTSQNSANTKTTNQVMKERTQAIDRIHHSVENLDTAMQEVHQESDKTFDIIRMIDDIAFQTNLLALNAAIEASRAGEAGAGFAVVADEVRNLALRSAQAAKNTEELLEGIIQKIKIGFELMAKTKTDTVQIAQSSVQVKNLMESMASASQSQMQDIKQVNNTMSTVKEINQRNQIISEENSAVSQEMHQHVAQMKDIMTQLADLAGIQSLRGN